MTPELTAAVEEAYRAFASYRLQGALTVCRCPVCVGPEMERALTTMPLREIPRLVLAEYTSSAHSWDDNVARELRYFLPRYFELMALGQPPTNLDLPVCLSRLKDASYRQEWPNHEANAIDAFFLALFREGLTAPVTWTRMGFTNADPVEDILCLVANAGGDLTPLLAAWDADRGCGSALHAANMIVRAVWNSRRLDSEYWLNPHTEAAMQQVVAFLQRPEWRALLEAACLAETDSAAASLLSQAESIVSDSV